MSREKSGLPQCYLSGGGCRVCKRTFSVDPETHRKNRQFVWDSKEHGGNMLIDFNKGLVEDSDNINQGRYNRIELDRGVIDWHSHPGRCRNDNMCALGLPSPQDVHNITVGTIHGTQAHLVYAKEGTYLLQIAPALVEQMRSDGLKRHQIQEQFYSVLSDLHTYFLENPSVTYKAYRRKWLSKARALGINVRFFPKDKRPKITLQYDCATESQGRLLAPVVVPPGEEELPKLKPKSKRKTKRKTIAKASTTGRRGVRARRC